MAPHSSTLAWKIPWTEEPGSLQSMGSLRVGHDWALNSNNNRTVHSAKICKVGRRQVKKNSIWTADPDNLLATSNQ